VHQIAAGQRVTAMHDMAHLDDACSNPVNSAGRQAVRDRNGSDAVNPWCTA
jgi:hypothetical protein